MARGIVIAGLVAALVLSAPAQGFVPTRTTWTLQGVERFRTHVERPRDTGAPRSAQEFVLVEGATIAFDDEGRWTLTHPEAALVLEVGVFTGRTLNRGGRRFRAVPSPESAAPFRDYLAGSMRHALAADLVEPERWVTGRLALRGRVATDGRLEIDVAARVRGRASYRHRIFGERRPTYEWRGARFTGRVVARFFGTAN